MTVLVTGARGNVGSRVVAKLAEAGHPVRAAARDLATLEVPEGAEPVLFDISAPDRDALDGADTVFLYPTFEPIDDFLAAAEKSGVQHIVLLSSPGSFEALEHEGPIGQAHQAIERALADSGLGHTILYPSWLATNAIRDWADEIRSTGRVGIAFPDWEVSPIHIDDIAEVAADLLTRSKHRARMVILTGPESTRHRDIVAQLAEALGKPIGLDELTREEAIARLPEWFPQPIFESLMAVAEASLGAPAPLNNSVERITGHRPRTFRDWVEANHDAFL